MAGLLICYFLIIVSGSRRQAALEFEHFVFEAQEQIFLFKTIRFFHALNFAAHLLPLKIHAMHGVGQLIDFFFQRLNVTLILRRLLTKAYQLLHHIMDFFMVLPVSPQKGGGEIV